VTSEDATPSVEHGAFGDLEAVRFIAACPATAADRHLVGVEGDHVADRRRLGAASA
jgi:hypothetical protein